MQRKLLIVLGNGFTIDFLNFLDRDDIDVRNLFSKGSEVPWPTSGKPGFLSFKHCPNLWNLGARPNMSVGDSWALIEDIITCVNVYASQQGKTPANRSYQPNDIYIYAYKELLQYIKHLFIYYDKKIESIPEKIKEWSWFKFLQNSCKDSEINEITVVTYNYDIWLERILKDFKIPFNVGQVGDKSQDTKITILKPHGSISFIHKEKLDLDSYSIKLDRELLDGASDDFFVEYKNLENNYLVTALIPPAGESSRFNHTWSGQIRSTAKAKASSLGEDDELIICGLSYWYVDRAELDELFVSCDFLADVVMINPSPQRTLTAVLTSIFSNFIVYTNSKTLDKILS